MKVNKKILTLLLIFVISSLPFVLTAQEPVTVKKSDNKVIIEGKVYFIHVVKPGQTLFSISKAYDVTEKDIAIENPGVYSGLQVGQMLKIPEQVPDRPSAAAGNADTTQFIYHVLKQGENIFALSRMYNVSPEAIREANPDLDYTNLQIGQVILIPRAKSVYNTDDFILHKVRRRDTLFGLSKRYNVSIGDINKYNPEIQWGGLKTGQIIRIPKPGITVEAGAGEQALNQAADTIAPLQEDTLQGLSLDQYAETLPYYHGKELNVAFLIPFGYKIQQEQPEENPEDTEMGPKNIDQASSDQLPASVNLLEFMQGSLIAIDSLRKSGLSLNVHYFDTQKSPSHTRDILSSPFFRNVDLIIGPFYSWNVEIVNDFSLSRHIPLICPFYANDSLTASNPYFFQLNPSYTTEFKLAARYLAKDFDKNFIFIYNADSLEMNKIEYFKNELLKSLQNYTYSENVIVKEIIYDDVARADISSDLTQALSKDKKNIVIIPFTDEAFVTSVVSQLYFQLRNFNIEVFGMPQWSVFPNSDFLYYHKLGLTYITPYYYSFDDPKVKTFLSEFRKGFKAEPSFTTRKGCPYAFLGHDATFAFLDAIRKTDKRFVEYILNDADGQLMPGYHFRKKSLYGGFENQSLNIVRFNKDFTISVMDVPLDQRIQEILPGQMQIKTRTDTVPDFRK